MIKVEQEEVESRQKGFCAMRVVGVCREEGNLGLRLVARGGTMVGRRGKGLVAARAR